MCTCITLVGVLKGMCRYVRLITSEKALLWCTFNTKNEPESFKCSITCNNNTLYLCTRMYIIYTHISLKKKLPPFANPYRVWHFKKKKIEFVEFRHAIIIIITIIICNGVTKRTTHSFWYVLAVFMQSEELKFCFFFVYFICGCDIQRK